MEYFKIITQKAEYIAERIAKGEPFIVKVKFANGNVEAVYTFKNHANTAVAQQIFNIDEHSI